MRALRLPAARQRARGALAAVASGVGWRWVILGLAGTSVLAAVSPPLLTGFDGPAVTWWYNLAVPGRDGLWNTVAAYAGICALIVSWVMVGRRIRRGTGSLRVLWLPAAAWTAPLLVGPPLFSRDIYSYLSQATLAELHLSPYTHMAATLAGTRAGAVLSAVSPAWRHTPSPYGPLFLWLGSALVDLAGHGVIAGVLVMRLPALLGLLLMAVFVPRLARSYGADPRRALWLAVLSPLVLFELIAAGHNDALMVGLMVAGLALATEDHPVAGVALCAVAAMVKLPALVGCVAIAVAWARSGTDRLSAARSVAWSAVVSVGTIAAVSAATGLGFGWLSPTVLLTPARGSIEVTPATAIGDTISGAAHLVGVSLAAKPTVTGVWVLTLLAAAVISGLVVLRCRMEGLAAAVATVMIAVVVAGPAMWPWYLTWGFTLLAVIPGIQWSRAVQLATVGGCLVLAPTGQINIPSTEGPYVAAGWLIVAGVAAARMTAARRGRIPGSYAPPLLPHPDSGVEVPVAASPADQGAVG